MKTGLKFLGGVLVSLACAAQAFGGDVIFNEIMYHPPGTNVLEQWFELHNTGASGVDLSGWQITKGVAFTFPASTFLPAGGYLVVAADDPTFASGHPGVTNFVAGWIGTLGHSLELSDNTGQAVNSVQFYDQGDWAVRVLGTGGVPGALDRYGGLGWEWFAAHDGGGASLELINAGLPNTFAQNWGSSSVNGGTPGQANSIAGNNIAPLVTDVAHSPAIPQPTGPVTVIARVLDEQTTGVTVILNWRVDGAASFNAEPMSDDGAHGDGLAGDGIYGAILPVQSDKTIVEFYVEARDAANNARTYPSWTAPAGSTRTANLLYQVDAESYSGNQPVYRVIMTAAERSYLNNLSDDIGAAKTDSDANMNATWITTDGVLSGGTSTQVRYNAGVRNRGHGSRHSRPHNFHINIPSDRLWKNQAGINLNSQYAYSQVLGSAIFRRLAIPMADSRAVQVRVNGVDEMTLSLPDINSFGSYAANEQYNNDFVKRSWPLDPHGNSYRGIRDPAADISGVADLSWQGPDYAVSGYTNVYYKQNNFIENDWSDLIDLIAVLNSANGYQASSYAGDVEQRLNVDEWMGYMAANTLLDNNETCLANGYGDDYALYRGTTDTRFLVLPYDLDTVMARGLTPVSPRDGLFRMTALSVMDRFMKTPEFAPRYYKSLKTLADTAFSPAQMNPFLDQVLGNYVPQATIDTMKAFNASRVDYVLSQIPMSITVTSALPVVNGYPRTTTPTAALSGQANAVETRQVLVNGSAASWSAWDATWTMGNVALQPGINHVLVQSLDGNGDEFDRAYFDVWFDDGSVQSVSGSIAVDTTWTAAGGPYNVTGNLTIPNGVTLTIQPGTTVYVASGASITVNGTGRILAEGADAQRIHFTRVPGGGNWGSLDFINSTVESHLAYVDFDSCGGTTIGGHNAQIHVNNAIVFIDHCTWPPTPVVEYISFDGSSFIVQNCVFPTYPPPTGPESLHGVNGIPVGGYGIFRDNYFGHTWGFNDTIDFTGGNRPGAILQIINNVFDGASDDNLDLDSTDAWIEGNTFMHVHRDPTRTDDARDTASAISGGVDFANQFSEWTIINNLFYDVDHAILNKGGSNPGAGRFIFINNTLVHVNKENGGGLETDIAAFDFTDDGLPLPDQSYGAGAYVANNIIWDCPMLTANYNPANHTVIFDNNILSQPWTGSGSNNVVIEPGLNLDLITDVATADWKTVQAALTPRPGSTSWRSGYGAKYDRGGLNPPGILIYGEPPVTTASASATLTVAPGGTFNWGSAVPPYLWGYTHYKWRLDNGAWSAETPITTQPTISLNGLGSGPHTVFVTGKNDAGYYQDDAFVYPTNAGIAAHVTASHTWTVNPNYSHVRLNEVLAKNVSAVPHGAGFPDLVELYNDGGQTVDLGDMSITDSASTPRKFVFPSNTLIGPGQYLVLYADNNDGTPGIHLGFNLKASGDDLYLFDKLANGGGLLDSVVFGIQLADNSMGRGQDGAWTLCVPTFGAANVTAPLGDYRHLRINEWLADEQFADNNDFIELYNPDFLPVPLGGLSLSDAAGAPGLSPVPALSFIDGNGFTTFIADGDTGQGADHVAFKLSADVGLILLSAPDLSLIDAVSYGPQQTDVSQGRSPSGGDTITSFAQPTGGGPNPGPAGVISVTNITQTATVLLDTTESIWSYDNSGVDQGTAWRAPGFNDASWASGKGLFGSESTPQEYPYPFQTTIPAPNAGGHITVYYRSHFQWDGGMTGFQLIATNFVDDGAVYYLNGVEVGRLRVSANPVVYSTLAANQPTEGVPEVLMFPTNDLVSGDNVMAAEVHQTSTGSSDDVFGMSLSAVVFTTNVITQTFGLPIVLNEVLGDNQSLTNFNGHTADYVEIYNPSTNELDLSDLSLSDDPNAPRKWIFPANTTVGPLAYMLIYCDDTSPASNANTGFALNRQGDGVFLFHRPSAGGALLDGIRFGLQMPDFSVGRAPNGSGAWSLNVPTPGAPNTAAALGGFAALKINEWMADPLSGSDWFEIYNGGGQPVALGGLFLTDDLADKTQSPVPPLSFIGVGAHAFVRFAADGNLGAGADHVNFSLKKSGESIGIYSPAGVLIDGINFGPQQTGVSQGRFPDGAANVVSFSQTASAGESNYLPLPNAVVNEALTHTDPPLEDAIEFYNPGGADATIGGWYLSNSQDDLKKFRVSDGTIIPAGGFKVFYEYQFNPTNGSSIPFTLNSAHGDQVYLSEADASGNLTGYRASAKFGAAANGVSFGRLTNSVGAVEFVAMSGRSFGVDNPSSVGQFRTGTGAPNPVPLVGPVVINEIMFQPSPDGGTLADENTAEEFIELRNIAPTDVPLFDPAAPTNAWKIDGGVRFTFPQNVTLPVGGYLLVVNFDPVANASALAAFRSKYSVATGVPIYGPYAGNLNNTGENIALLKPDPPQLPPHPDAGFVPYVLVEEINYSALPPWPTGAAGTGNSVQRKVGADFGDDPANWIVAAPTAGGVNAVASPGDADADGLPDTWEILYFGSINDPRATPGADPDGDGFANLQEYLAGTSPIDPNSYLKIDAVGMVGGQPTIQFTAAAGKTYRVLYRDNVASGAWLKLADVPAQTGPTVITVDDPTFGAATARFYRLVTP